MPRLIQIIGLIVFVIVGVLLWAGVLRDVDITEKRNETIYGVYLVHNGPYYTSEDTLEEVRDHLELLGVSTERGFGMYFQDPATTPEELLTSWVGYIVNDPIEVDRPFKLMTIEPRDNVYSEFRGHPLLAGFKVYDEMEEYMARRGYDITVPTLEIYTPAGYGQTRVEYYKEIRSAEEPEGGIEVSDQ